MPPKNRYDIAQRAQALTFLQVGCSFEDRGYDPAVSFILKEEYLMACVQAGHVSSMRSRSKRWYKLLS
jgi:hypothetical protein